MLLFSCKKNVFCFSQKTKQTNKKNIKKCFELQISILDYFRRTMTLKTGVG